MEGCKDYGEDILDLVPNYNQFLAINSASAGMVVKLSFDGENYTADYHYYIIDYYNWDLNPIVLDEFNLYGIANNYLNYGKYSSSISWKKGDDIQTAMHSEILKALFH